MLTDVVFVCLATLHTAAAAAAGGRVDNAANEHVAVAGTADNDSQSRYIALSAAVVPHLPPV